MMVIDTYYTRGMSVAASPTTPTARVGRKERAMTKYYFISYICCNGNVTTYGHCMMQVCNLDLTSIIYKIKEVNGFKNLPTILCLKDLSKKEYEMLNGGENERTDNTH